MRTLNCLCENDISDEDCFKCAKHGMMFSCPKGCSDFIDGRKRMSPAMLEMREQLMKKLGVFDNEPNLN